MSASPHRSILSTLAAIPLLVLSAGSAPAQQGGTEQRFEDWKLACPDQRSSQETPCLISQRQVDPNTDLDILGAAVYFLPGRNDATILIQVPPQADSKKPLSLQVDRNPRLLIDIERCTENICATTGTMNADLLKQFRNGTQALVGFEVDETDQAVAVPLSLKGFTAAYKALEDRKR